MKDSGSDSGSAVRDSEKSVGWTLVMARVKRALELLLWENMSKGG